jgi:hypothetical protein
LQTVDTPEFLVWAIEYTCPIRGSQDGSDPERTERQLRAARAVSEARRDGRVFEGLCVEPPNGFRLDEALAVYGGAEAVERACDECPANALAEDEADALAGCYGIVAMPENPSAVHDAVERGIGRAYANTDWSELCAATTPRWYGLWMGSPLRAEQLLVRYRVLEAAVIEDEVTRDGVRQLLTGLNVAFNADCRVHVAMYPRGRVEGTQWQLVPHCPRCKASWNDVDPRHCNTCGYDGYPAPDMKRKARGSRPYFPLERLLGKEAAEAFLLRYEAFRVSQRLPDQP